MDVVMYRASLKGLPPGLLKKSGRKKVLHLLIPSKNGRFEVFVTEGMIIKTSDPISQAVLDAYSVPKAPNIFKSTNGKMSSLTWKHEDYADVHPFTRVDSDVDHHVGI
jgi:hypothetical protein